MSTATSTIEELANREYKHGFFTEIESETVPRGLSEDVIRAISAKKNEPAFMLDWRLKAYRHWLTMEEPAWAYIRYPSIDYQDIIYYSAPKPKKQLSSMNEVDPELRRTFEKLGISLDEQKRLSGVAVDAVFDSVSVATTFKAKLAELGIIFCSFSEAVQNHPELVRKYLGSVVPYNDNFFATLNSAVFSDGSFLLHPQGRALPDGTVHLFPHQRGGHRPVRANAHRCRGRRLCQLPGRLHGPDARHQSVARCRGGAGGGRPQLADQVFDRAELVSRRQGRQGRHLQLCHQAWRLPRRELEDFLDPGGNRLGDHVEISERHFAGQQRGR